MLEPSDVIDLFFNHLPTKTINAGEIIFLEGDKGETMFAVMIGEIELSKNGCVLETIREHDVFGEGAFVQAGKDRCTTARAKTECKLVELDREKFLFLVQETPLFALEIIRSLSSRLRTIKQQLS